MLNKKRFTLWRLWLTFACSALLLGCGQSENENAVWRNDAALSGTIAVAPFRASGSAESGNYALQLLDFSGFVENELASRGGWRIVESEREALVAEERNLNEQVLEESTAMDENGQPVMQYVEELVSDYPAASYMLLGTLQGFELAPQRYSGQGLAKRQNRVRASIQVRVLDVQTREWITSRAINVDELISDDMQAETQINHAMSLAARQVAQSVLLSLASPLQIMSLDTDQQRVTVSGGSQQGLENGMQFDVYSTDLTRESSRIKIVETRADTALAEIQSGQPQVADSLGEEPVDASPAVASVRPLSIAMGGFYKLDSGKKMLVTGNLIEQIQFRLMQGFQQDGGVAVQEQYQTFQRSMLSQQMLTDLSKGREPGLPLGTIQGVDYLVFGTLSHTDVTAARQTKEVLFGKEIEKTIPATAEVHGAIYLVDVNTGYYALSEIIEHRAAVTSDSGSELVNEIAKSFADKAFARLILKARPPAVIGLGDASIILNVKQSAGIAIGDQLTVQNKGEAVVDANSGMVLSNVGGAEVGSFEIVRFDAGGWAHAKLLTGKMPAVGAPAILASTQGAAAAPQAPENAAHRSLNW